MGQPLNPDRLWLNTSQMAQLLGIHRTTLNRLKASGYFSEDRHFRKAVPTSPRGRTLWHSQRVALKMNAL